jgi:hypothetical protein
LLIELNHGLLFFTRTSEPNILPSLKFVSGSVTIEPWNSDINCSKLVSQSRDNIIATLYCNGTDSVTASSSPTTSASPNTSSRGLSEGGWAGIGTSIGAIVIGAIITIVWLYLRHRRDQAPAADATTAEAEVKPPDLSGLNEADMT